MKWNDAKSVKRPIPSPTHPAHPPLTANVPNFSLLSFVTVVLRLPECPSDWRPPNNA